MGVSKAVALWRKDRFVELFLATMNATDSYSEIHPKASRKTCQVESSRLLNDPYVIERLADARAALTEKTGLTAEKVLGEMGHVAFSDIGDIWEPSPVSGDLRLRPIADWPEKARRAIAGIKAKHIPARLSKEGVEIEPENTVFEIKFWGKPETLKVLASHLGLLAPDAPPPDPTHPSTVIGTQIFIIGGQRMVV